MIEDIIERATATHNVQVRLADPANPLHWVWPEKAVDQWPLDIANLNLLLQTQSEADAEWQSTAGLLGTGLTKLADHSRDIARLARTKFRNDPATLHLWQAVRLRRNSRAAIFRSAHAVRSTWAKSAPAWVPMSGLTLAAYQGQITTCGNCAGTHKDNETELRQLGGQLQVAAARLDDESMAWYSDALTHFPDHTAAGILIRTDIPTTTVPPAPIGPVVIAHLLAEGDTIHFDCDAAHATKFTYLHLAPGAPDYVVVAEDSPEKSLTLEQQAAGLHWFKVVPGNASSTGPASAPVSVEVAAVAAPSPARGATPVVFVGDNGAARSA